MATVPVEATMTALHKVSAAEWNSNVRDAINFLLNTPAAQIYQNVSQSIPNATFTAITFDTAAFNNDGAWSSGSNTRFTCQTAGTYRVSVNATFLTNSTGVRELQFAVNGVGIQTFNAGALTSVATTVSTAAFEYHLDVGDYIQINAYQNSGGALSLSAAPLATFLLVEFARNI